MLLLFIIGFAMLCCGAVLSWWSVANKWNMVVGLASRPTDFFKLFKQGLRLITKVKKLGGINFDNLLLGFSFDWLRLGFSLGSLFWLRWRLLLN